MDKILPSENSSYTYSCAIKYREEGREVFGIQRIDLNAIMTPPIVNNCSAKELKDFIESLTTKVTPEFDSGCRPFDTFLIDLKCGSLKIDLRLRFTIIFECVTLAASGWAPHWPNHVEVSISELHVEDTKSDLVADVVWVPSECGYKITERNERYE